MLDTRIKRIILNKFMINEFDTIKISNLQSKNKGVEFNKIILASLKLIRDLDPRKYRRIKDEVNWVINTSTPMKYGAMYSRGNKVCDINFDNYSEDTTLESAYYAGLIIHEATHGFLKTKGFETSIENRLQIERICTSEQNRFYKLMEEKIPEYKGFLIRKFDPNNWHYHWYTPKYKKLYDGLKRELKDQSD